MGKAAGLAAVVPNPNELVVPNAGAGTGGGAATAATADGANDGIAVAVGAPNANDDGVLVMGGAPNPPRFPPSDGMVPVGGAAPENVSNRNEKLQKEKNRCEFFLHCVFVVYQSLEMIQHRM